MWTREFAGAIAGECDTIRITGGVGVGWGGGGVSGIYAVMGQQEEEGVRDGIGWGLVSADIQAVNQSRDVLFYN